MVFSRWANAEIALVSIIALLMSCNGGAALRTWSDGPDTFSAGTFDDTEVVNGSIQLVPETSVIDTWINASPPASPPGAVWSAMAYDSDHKATVLFGGMEDQTPRNDTWVYSSGTNTWTRMYPSSAPSKRSEMMMVFSKATGESVLFGGINYHDLSPSEALGDTWVYDYGANSWTEKHPAASPSARFTYAMGYDTTNDIIMLFGGWTGYDGGYQEPYNDTWVYDPKQNTWTDIKPASSPPARHETMMTFDRDRGVFILFGGRIGNKEYANDTWTYDYKTNNWTQMDTSPAPSQRREAGFVYDGHLRQCVLLGGCTSSGFTYLNDTWTFTPASNNWTRHNLSDAPTRAAFGMMVYDSDAAKVIYWGGGGDFKESNALWVLDTPTGAGDYRSFGRFTSAPFDTGGSAYFGKLEWNATCPSSTSLWFQLRTAQTEELLNKAPFLGPDGSTATFYGYSGNMISDMHDADRWVQYTALFYTTDYEQTPKLKEVSIQFNLLQKLSIADPAPEANWTWVQNISWTALDPDGDALSFDIYLLLGNESSLLARDIPDGVRSWSWDTSAVANGSCRIKIVARDGNPEIPLNVECTSGNFTIYHPVPPPPPNQPPRVVLISPPNNSVQFTKMVHLTWQGIDPDDASLTYTLRYSDRPFSQGILGTCVTTEHYFDLKNLSDSTTYYWSVDASDGESNASDISIDVWSFTTRLFSENHPIHITSTPNTTAWAGIEYTYNLTSADGDGDIPLFTLVMGPPNISLNSSTGKFRWTPTTADIGNRSIIIQVSDQNGSTDRQIFTITVKDTPIPPAIPPKCAITYPANGARVNGTIQVKGTASNGTLPLSIIKVRIDNGPWTTAFGLSTWSFSLNTAKLAKGPHHIEARAFAANLSSETASVSFVVGNPEPTVTTGGNQWCLPAMAIAIIAGIAVFVFMKKRVDRGAG